MKLIEQNTSKEYVFFVRREELLGIRFAFNDFERIEGSSDWLNNFEREFEIKPGTALNLYLYKIAPIYEKNVDTYLNLDIEEIFIVNHFLVNESLILNIDCDSITGTSFAEVYSMVDIFLQVLRTISFSGISDEAQINRQNIIKQDTKTFDRYRSHFIERDAHLVEKLGVPRFVEKK